MAPTTEVPVVRCRRQNRLGPGGRREGRKVGVAQGPPAPAGFQGLWGGGGPKSLCVTRTELPGGSQALHKLRDTETHPAATWAAGGSAPAEASEEGAGAERPRSAPQAVGGPPVGGGSGELP